MDPGRTVNPSFLRGPTRFDSWAPHYTTCSSTRTRSTNGFSLPNTTGLRPFAFVAQWKSTRLLTGLLRVRVPPEAPHTPLCRARSTAGRAALNRPIQVRILGSVPHRSAPACRRRIYDKRIEIDEGRFCRRPAQESFALTSPPYDEESAAG